MANLKGWLNSGWEKISCTIIGNKVALDVVPRDLDGGVIGGSDAPSHTVIVDENGPLLTGDNPGSVVLRGNDGSIQGTTANPLSIDLNDLLSLLASGIEISDDYSRKLGITRNGLHKTRVATLDFTDDLASAATKTVTIPGVENYVLYPVALTFAINAPTGAESGTHDIYIYSSARANKYDGVKVSAAFGSNLLLGYGGGMRTGTSQSPPLLNDYRQVLKEQEVLEGETLNIVYENNTNVEQTNNATLKVYYKLVPLLD